jgi:hypothetical protein
MCGIWAFINFLKQNDGNMPDYNQLFADLNRTKKIQLLLHPEWWFDDNGKKSFLICLKNEFEKSLIELQSENRIFADGVSFQDFLR